MWNLNKIVKILYKGNYKYYFEFDDGVSGVVDFTGIWLKGPVFRCIEDENIFKTATINGGTICWNNEIDIAPETIYEKVA